MKSTIYLACLESMEMKAVGWYLDELLEYVIASNRCDELLRYLFRSVYKELHADHETGAADNK